MDEQRQNDLLAQLIPMHRKSDFAEIFQRITAGENKNEQFLLKMELKRLVTPSKRVIDLRSSPTDPNCQPFQYNGLTHFMSESNIEAFKQLLKHYDGNYTQGVFEQMQQLRRQDPNKRGRVDTRVKAFQFGHYHGRVEERMFISMPIEIQTEQMMVYGGMSSNMSISGMRIRYDREDDPPIGEPIKIYFTGLEQEFANPVLSRGTDYVIIDTERNDKGLWARLKRLNTNDPEFESFFESFLEEYKGRYRVDVVHLVDATLVKSYQQFFLPRSSSLPLYFSGEQPPQLRYVLCNDFSRNTLDYWYNEFRQNVLGQTFHAQRMRSLMSQSCGQTVLYSFVHSYNRKLYFYSATHEELLAAPELRQLFFYFGANKTSWRVFTFQWQQIHLDNAFAPPIVPKQQRRTDEKTLREQLADLSVFGLLTDITNESSKSRYRQTFHSDKNPNELAPFGQYRHLIPEIKVIAHKYMQMRKEARYQYRSMAEIMFNSQMIEGWVNNFSTGGLQLELDYPAQLKAGDNILVNLPQFQKLVRTFKLTQLPYLVVNVQQNCQTIHLQAVGHAHEGSRFFSQLITSNIDKLGHMPEINVFEGLSEALRQLYCHDLFKHVLFINKEGGLLKLKLLAYGQSPSPIDPLLYLSRARNKANMYQLIHPDNWQQWLLSPLQELHDEQKVITLRILMHLHKNSKKVIACQREKDFQSEAELNGFVVQAMEHGDFKYIELKASRTGKPDATYIKAEMAYLGHYATHKAKELAILLQNTYAVVEINDLTAEWQALKGAKNL